MSSSRQLRFVSVQSNTRDPHTVLSLPSSVSNWSRSQRDLVHRLRPTVHDAPEARTELLSVVRRIVLDAQA
ncbi:hypothetical protein C9J85_07875 [Haloferax sp. wsp5]|nr:hypothetical protein C9J85_07875 [Haloferax sp. wsp5]